jgi:hypothetical protein
VFIPKVVRPQLDLSGPAGKNSSNLKVKSQVWIGRAFPTQNFLGMMGVAFDNLSKRFLNGESKCFGCFSAQALFLAASFADVASKCLGAFMQSHSFLLCITRPVGDRLLLMMLEPLVEGPQLLLSKHSSCSRCFDLGHRNNGQQQKCRKGCGLLNRLHFQHLSCSFREKPLAFPPRVHKLTTMILFAAANALLRAKHCWF